jgi:type II secretion system protein G
MDIPRKGFTLIELLIVVAIIAILAAIAVPNFLEAQTRSKVSRVKADMRTIATGMESYLLDYNTYVNDSDNTLGKGGEGGLAYLTSPIAYLTTLPQDPFQSQLSASDNDAAKYFELGSGADNAFTWKSRFGSSGNSGGARIQSWLLISVGTNTSPKNQADDTTNNDEWPTRVPGSPCDLLHYDPTNGTVSKGDIYRAGGALGMGNYRVNGRPLGEINF